MTCVLGIETDDGVVFASDSFCGNEYQAFQLDKPKWVQVTNALVIGFAGSPYSAACVAELPRRRHAAGMADHQYLERVYEDLRQIYAARDFDATEAELLAAYRGRVYLITAGSVLRSSHGFYAIGSGGEIARAVLRVTPDKPARERAKLALETAAELCPTVRAPFRAVIVPGPARRKRAA